MPTEFATIITQATLMPRPNAESMVAALQQAEISARREKLGISFTDLVGEWRLCFVTGARKAKHKRGIVSGNGYYLPKFVAASITFAHDTEADGLGTVTNQLQVSGLAIKFTGPCRYPGKKNLLVFDFTQIQIKLFGRTIYQGKVRSGKSTNLSFAEQPISKLPFFAFFWAGATEIAARGRSGGLAVWVKAQN
jgi:hypothetical protein